jgi:SulP family sulfate permease
LLALIYLAAPLASYIPLAALGAVLALVSWNMAEQDEFIAIIKRSRAEGLILLVTFLLTIFRDLTEGIVAGVVLSSFIFMHRMAGLASHGRVDQDGEDGTPYMDAEHVVYKIEGAFFFGVAAEIADVFDRIGRHPKEFIFDLSDLMFIDMSAAHALHATIKKLEHGGTKVLLHGARDSVAATLARQGLKADYFQSIEF